MVKRLGGVLYAGDVGQIVPQQGQHPGGEHLIQRVQDLLQAEMEQADQVVDAHQEGEQGENQKIGQGGGGLGRAHPAIEPRRLQKKGGRGPGQQFFHHSSTPPCSE